MPDSLSRRVSTSRADGIVGGCRTEESGVFCAQEETVRCDAVRYGAMRSLEVNGSPKARRGRIGLERRPGLNIGPHVVEQGKCRGTV